MHALRLRCRAAERDLVAAELYEQGTLGIHEVEVPEEGLIELQAWFHEPLEIPSLHSYGPQWDRVADVDWVAESQAAWEPVSIGEKLWLVPEWCDDPPPPGRLRLVSHPGEASGSGLSEPTQLALEALERHVRAADVVLDVGTGSGVLTAAAALLGARRVIACDIEAPAASAALRNLRADGIAAEVFAGSPRALVRGVASLVLANLNAVALLAIATELSRVTTADARLIVSGFRERRVREIRRAFEARGLVVREERSRGDWRCLVLAAVP
jgi:ribosomal protein L11 methyltransferase